MQALQKDVLRGSETALVERPRFLFVDGLRGVAALWVVLFHAQAGGHITHLSNVLPTTLTKILFEWGNSGVAIFFALSGFVIAHSIRNAEMSPAFILRFMVRRSIRLDPPYWFSIVLVLSLALLSASVKSEGMQWPSTGAILAHLGYLQTLLGFDQINDVYWTLCYEIQFYLVFCLLVWFAKRMGTRGQPIVFIPAAAISLIWPLGLIESEVWPGLFINLFFGFLAGVFAYWAWTKRIPKMWFIAYTAVLLAGAFVREDRFAGGCATTAGLLLLCGQLNCFGRWLNWRSLQFLGLISYSLYLTHNPVSGASFFVLQRLLGSTVWAETFNLFLVIVICIAFSAVTWWVVERPCIEWGRRITTRRMPVSARRLQSPSF